MIWPSGMQLTRFQRGLALSDCHNSTFLSRRRPEWPPGPRRGCHNSRFLSSHPGRRPSERRPSAPAPAITYASTSSSDETTSSAVSTSCGVEFPMNPYT